MVVLSTALGIRAWSEAAESRGVGDGLGEALRDARILARGPKASGAALTAGWDVDWVSPLASAADMVRELAEMGVTGRRVAVQLDGRAEPVLADAVRALGADVVAVPVYRWELPRDADACEAPDRGDGPGDDRRGHVHLVAGGVEHRAPGDRRRPAAMSSGSGSRAA